MIYQKNENGIVISGNKIKFKDLFFWKRVHEHRTNNFIIKDNENKYKIC